jgi:guanine nucleotide-binding protein G(i) subunit alpha
MTNEPFSQQEREDFREVLWANATQAMQAILNAVIEMELQVMDPECQRAALYLVKTQLPQPLAAYRTSIADAVQKLWRDPVIQMAFGRSREYQLVDSASYLFDRVPEMAKVDWLPTDQDMLRVRIKTTGIQGKSFVRSASIGRNVLSEILFTMEKHEFRLFDVGGQKSERRKWIQCFEDVQVCLFVAALSEFDLQMYEDSETVRLVQRV